MPNIGETWKHKQTGDLVKVAKINSGYVFVTAVAAGQAWWVRADMFLRGALELA